MWLSRRSDRRSYNWTGFRALIEHFQIPHPMAAPVMRATVLNRLHAEARTTEEPGAGNPHAGICAGAVG